MTVTYEALTPSLIENTTMQKAFREGEWRQISIKANEGYVLHDNNLDNYLFDEETGMPSDEITLGYTKGNITVRYDYDFAANPRELYAVPENQIFGGGGNNDHEIM